MAAGQMLSGEIDVLTFAYAFNGLLSDLCEDEPLGGDLLELFFAFETLEISFGAKRVGVLIFANALLWFILLYRDTSAGPHRPWY